MLGVALGHLLVDLGLFSFSPGVGEHVGQRGRILQETPDERAETLLVLGEQNQVVYFADFKLDLVTECIDRGGMTGRSHLGDSHVYA